MSISGLLDCPFGNFCFSYVKLFSITSLFAIPYVILPLFKGKGAKASNKDNYILLSSLLPAKFTRWSSSIVWKNLPNSRDSFQICNSASKKGLAVLKPLLLF